MRDPSVRGGGYDGDLHCRIDTIHRSHQDGRSADAKLQDAEKFTGNIGSSWRHYEPVPSTG